MGTRAWVYSLLGVAVLGTALVTVPINDVGTDAATLPIPAMDITSGHAARWDECNITYRINADHAPRGAVADFDHARAIVTAATAVTFTPAGTTSLIPQGDDARAMTSSEGVDMVVSWADRAHKPGSDHTSALLYGEHVAGRTELVTAYRGRRGIVAPKHEITAAAMVLLDERGDVGGRSGQLGYAIHELGHVIGIGHSEDPASIMYGDGLGTRDYSRLSPEDTAAFRAAAPHCGS